MRHHSRSFSLLLAAFCLTTLLGGPPESGPTNTGLPQALEPNSGAWRQDEACQLVFFAVLEGLYKDGVPDEVVDLVVPPAAEGQRDVKRCFVFRCPMCHAAYEAFVLYSRRQAFAGSNEQRSTLGNDFDRSIVDRLRSDQARERVYALGDLIRPWIERRLDSLALKPAERERLVQQMLKHAEDGNKRFLFLRSDPTSVYFEWQFYGGCQACEAARTIASRSPQPDK